MKKYVSWQIIFGLSLIAVSALLYGLHYFIFRDSHHLYSYLLTDLAFIPLEVLFVSMVIHGLLTSREKKTMLRKLNMVISVFFTEAGIELLGKLASFDPNSGAMEERLSGLSRWNDKEFGAKLREIHGYSPGIRAKEEGDIDSLKSFLAAKRPTILGLLENPNLLEHETFTDLLWAVSHLADELVHRPHLGSLPDSDYAHLSGDIERAYLCLIKQWITYLRHLKADYPYLFSLACRTNPFDPQATPVVQ